MGAADGFKTRPEGLCPCPSRLKGSSAVAGPPDCQCQGLLSMSMIASAEAMRSSARTWSRRATRSPQSTPTARGFVYSFTAR